MVPYTCTENKQRSDALFCADWQKRDSLKDERLAQHKLHKQIDVQPANKCDDRIWPISTQAMKRPG